MGLFRRTPKIDPAVIDAMRMELIGLRARLEAAERQKQALESKVRELDVSTATLDATTTALVAAANALTARTDALGTQGTRLDDLVGLVAELGTRDTRIDDLAGRVAELGTRDTRIDDLAGRIAELGTQSIQLDELVARVGELGTQLQSVNLTDEEARAQLDDLAQRLSATADDVRVARDHAATIDARVSNVATELANQLGELGREIDVLVERTTIANDGAVIEQLRVGQVRLANEQARFEIAFRNDLASLAEQLRREGADARRTTSANGNGTH